MILHDTPNPMSKWSRGARVLVLHGHAKINLWLLTELQGCPHRNFQITSSRRFLWSLFARPRTLIGSLGGLKEGSWRHPYPLSSHTWLSSDFHESCSGRISADRQGWCSSRNLCWDKIVSPRCDWRSHRVWTEALRLPRNLRPFLRASWCPTRMWNPTRSGSRSRPWALGTYAQLTPYLMMVTCVVKKWI